jgi:serine/threonine protein kinase
MGSLLCGVIDYMSPEMVGFTDNICYDAKALDIYALGVILFEMINFCKPFVEYMNELIINKVYIERQVNRDYKYKPEIDPNI